MEPKETPAGEPAPPRGGMRPHVLARLQKLIEERLTEPLRVEELAREACLSPFHFSRMFKQATGHAPHGYLLMRRLERARTMLRDTNDPVAAVARACGFTTQAHFCNVFHKRVGTTPAAYRRQHRAAAPQAESAGLQAVPMGQEPS